LGLTIAVVDWRVTIADLSRAPLNARDRRDRRRAFRNHSGDIVIAHRKSQSPIPNRQSAISIRQSQSPIPIANPNRQSAISIVNPNRQSAISIVNLQS
jgi:hypothetical protein